MNGTVDSLKDYGAFVNLENGLSGLLHVSQISNQRIKHPGVVLKEGQNVTVKITGVKDGKISLSMKALTADGEPEKPVEKFDYKETGEATTGTGSTVKRPEVLTIFIRLRCINQRRDSGWYISQMPTVSWISGIPLCFCTNQH